MVMHLPQEQDLFRPHLSLLLSSTETHSLLCGGSFISLLSQTAVGKPGFSSSFSTLSGGGLSIRLRVDWQSNQTRANNNQAPLSGFLQRVSKAGLAANNMVSTVSRRWWWCGQLVKGTEKKWGSNWPHLSPKCLSVREHELSAPIPL